MKIRLEQIGSGEEEIVIRFRGPKDRAVKMAEAIDQVIREPGGARILETGHGAGWPAEEGQEGHGLRITARWEDQIMFPRLSDIYYLETVEGSTYAYLEDKVVKLQERLKGLEPVCAEQGFFRCSRSMLLNICKVSYLRSEPGSRIRATLENGEQVIISRKYGKALRRILKEGKRNEA